VIAAVSRSPTLIDVFGFDGDGHLLHNSSNNGVWSTTWDTIATFGACSDACELSAASWGANRMDVFVVVTTDMFNENNTLWQVTYDNNTWQTAPNPFPGLSGPDAVAAVSWGPSRIDLVATTTSFDDTGFHRGDLVQYFTNDGSHWSGPWPLGFIGQGFASDGHPRNVALSSWGVNVLDVVSEWQGQVAQLSFRPSSGWGSWNVFTFASPIAAPFGFPDRVGIGSVSSGPNRVDLTGLARDGDSVTAWHGWYNEVTPVGWFGKELLNTTGSCLDGWQNNTTCAQPCTSRVQGDQRACIDVLNCYRDNHCGPDTCATGNQVCGPNTLGFGNAPYPFAQQVVSCIPACSN
jgi:hypothetical protein